MTKFFKRFLPATMLAACCAVSAFALTACNEGKDYSEDLAKLQQQIDNLKTENDSLKNQISNLTPDDVDYSALIDELQQQIDALKNQNGDFSSEIDKLEQQIATQQKLIESLQNVVNVEPKIYKIGETFTYSYQGIDYFSIKYEQLGKLEETKSIKVKVTNLNMSEGMNVSQYIRGITYNSTYGQSKMEFQDKPLQKNEVYSEYGSARLDNTVFYFGFPTGDNGIIPYAIFDLTA